MRVHVHESAALPARPANAAVSSKGNVVWTMQSPSARASGLGTRRPIPSDRKLMRETKE